MVAERRGAGTGIGVDSVLKGDCGMGVRCASRTAEAREIMGGPRGAALLSEGPTFGDTAGSM